MIVLDLQTFRQTRENGNVTGVIYVETASGAFPEAGWSDFPVIILGWWAEALLHLEAPTRREVFWRFMDGSHSLTLAKIEGSNPGETLPLAKVADLLIEAAERVIAHCDHHKMFGQDLEILRTKVRQLKANQTVQRRGASRSAQIEIRPSVAAAGV